MGGCWSQRAQSRAHLQRILEPPELSRGRPWGLPQMALIWATCLNYMEHTCPLVTHQTQIHLSPAAVRPAPVPEPAAGPTEGTWAEPDSRGKILCHSRVTAQPQVFWWPLLVEVAPACALPRETLGFPSGAGQETGCSASFPQLCACLWGPPILWRNKRLCAFCCPPEAREGSSVRFSAGWGTELKTKLHSDIHTTDVRI